MRETAGNAFRRRLHLYAEKAINQGNKGGEVPMLVEASVEILSLLFLLGGLQALLWGLGLVGDSVSIHNTHVVNAVLPLDSKDPGSADPPSTPLPLVEVSSFL